MTALSVWDTKFFLYNKLYILTICVYQMAAIFSISFQDEAQGVKCSDCGTGFFACGAAWYGAFCKEAKCNTFSERSEPANFQAFLIIAAPFFFPYVDYCKR